MTKNPINSPGVFADARVDFAFKRIFGTERFKDATIGLINSIIKGIGVVDIEFCGTEYTRETANGKTICIDIVCKALDGTRFIVEMQRARRQTFQERMVYYTSKMISNIDVSKGDKKYEIPFTYVIAFTDFPLIDVDFMKPDSYKLHYITKDVESGHKMPGSTEIFFFDLSRFNKSLDEITDSTDYWVYLLKEVRNLTDVPDQIPREKCFDSFFEASKQANFTKDEKMEYDKAMMDELDYQSALYTAKVEGREESSIEIARNLKAKGLDVNMIAECTGLSIQKIEAL